MLPLAPVQLALTHSITVSVTTSNGYHICNGLRSNDDIKMTEDSFDSERGGAQQIVGLLIDT